MFRTIKLTCHYYPGFYKTNSLQEHVPVFFVPINANGCHSLPFAFSPVSRSGDKRPIPV